MPNKQELHQLQMIFRTIMRRMRKVWSEQTELGLNPTQFSVLEKLHTEGPLKVTEVAKLLCLTAGAVTGITDKLIELGYVERRRDEVDRRTVYLEMTELGKQAYNETIEQRAELFERFFDQVEDEQVRQFLLVCNQVNDNLDSMVSDCADA
ncbi:MarR family winged helix-turn-helix transcriptional regulator [Paenibacillus marinisediminis]